MSNSIVLKEIRYKNFMSIGNQEVVVQLDKYPNSIVFGKNGAGKSTMYEAIFFALYGVAFRKATKPELINNINNKGLLTTITFETQGSEYKVIRGMKPTTFEIWKDGELLDQSSKSKDYQAILEKTILKMSPKRCRQTMILGSRMFVPFMRLSAKDRRDVAEELLDIQIFSFMNTVAKNRARDANNLITDTKREMSSVQNDILHNRDVVKNLLQKQKEQEVSREGEVAQLEADITTAQSTIGKIEPKRDELVAGKTSEYDQKITEETKRFDTKISQERNRFEGLITHAGAELAHIEEAFLPVDGSLTVTQAELTTQKEKFLGIKSKFLTMTDGLNKDVQFFHDNDTCPTCNQDITAELKQSKIDEAQPKLDQYAEGIAKAEARVSETSTEISGIEAKISEVREHNNSVTRKQNEAKRNILSLESDMRGAIQTLNGDKQRGIQTLTNEKNQKVNAIESEANRQIAVLQSEIREKTATISRIKSKKALVSDDEIESKKLVLDELGNDYHALQKQHDELVTKHGELLEVIKMLKDDGIKRHIIKMYIPVINKLIAKYLSILGFPIKFVFDEEFKERIVTKGRRDLSYGLFSEGQKMRVDLAILFAFRDIPLLKSGASVNLLVFDEIADSSLDSDGWDAFFSIIESVSGGGNVFVISPKGDIHTDKFNNGLEFIMDGNFTKAVTV